MGKLFGSLKKVVLNRWSRIGDTREFFLPQICSCQHFRRSRRMDGACVAAACPEEGGFAALDAYVWISL